MPKLNFKWRELELLMREQLMQQQCQSKLGIFNFGEGSDWAVCH
jgi:hypothetical protein